MAGSYYPGRKPFSMLVAALVFSGLGYAAGEFIQIIDPYKITPISYQPGVPISKVGEIFKVRSCGCKSVLQEARFGSCITGLPVRCVIPTNKNYTLEVVFTPSETATEYFIRASIFAKEGKKVSVDVPMPGQKLIAGQHYLLTITVAFTSELQKKFFLARTAVIRKSDNEIVHCVEADYLGS